MAAEEWAVAVPETPQMEAAEEAGDGRSFVQEWLAALGIETDARAKLAAELFDNGITTQRAKSRFQEFYVQSTVDSTLFF